MRLDFGRDACVAQKSPPPTLRCRRSTSLVSTQIAAIAFFAYPAYGLVHGLNREWFTGIEDPHTIFLEDATTPASRPKQDLFFGTLQFQRVARAKLQLFAHGLGKHNPPRLIHVYCGIHNGII